MQGPLYLPTAKKTPRAEAQEASVASQRTFSKLNGSNAVARLDTIAAIPEMTNDLARLLDSQRVLKLEVGMIANISQQRF